MTLTAATGWIAEQEELLRVLLADSARWRTWTDSSTQAEALAHIYLDAIPQSRERDNWTASEHLAFMPYALVHLKPFIASERTTGYAKSATLTLSITDAVPDSIAHDIPEIGRRFKNNYGTVVDEMLVNAHKGGYLAFRELQIPEAWDRTPPEMVESQGDSTVIEMTFTKEGLR